ncbi:SNF1-related protein kinase regulatory subunit beta-3 [Rhodamnia argentea]|uniref:SNF1-related protein kinase regulatory subunit beta-3 n=1 Tax=Rhodamnia argentea TaxID=178133 RepID=A0A8B8NW63_9MYRT|nr:SNF1-related protein kinase regulatory subunit beta-3 [Rhodamnia argentea]
MSNQCPEDPEERTVVGFELPRSPDSSYNNTYAVSEDEARDPPLVPQQLLNPLLGCPATRDASESLPPPMSVLLNHLYIENREAPRSVVALGFTHRFHSKYVSVVLYKAVQRRGGTGS